VQEFGLPISVSPRPPLPLFIDPVADRLVLDNLQYCATLFENGKKYSCNANAISALSLREARARGRQEATWQSDEVVARSDSDEATSSRDRDALRARNDSFLRFRM
jgi:hypothetical protein